MVHPGSGCVTARSSLTPGDREHGGVLRWILAALLAAFAAAHLWVHYAPRERAGVPRSGGLPGTLLTAPGYEHALWLPYPHQNLAMLRRAVGDADAFLASAARLAGLPEPDLPGFGPFAAPPARELAVAWRGEGFVLAAEVYPLMARLARIAGRLAGNPWLAGGEVALGGRSAVVAWRGSTWSVAAGIGGPDPGTAPAVGPALALLQTARPPEPFPSGLYRLERRGPDLLVRDVRAAAADGPAVLQPPEIPLLVVAGPAGGRAAGALALFESPEELLPGLPGAVVVSRAGGPRWRLPGERLLRAVGLEPRAASAEGWTVLAFRREDLDRGLALVPWLAQVARPADREELVRGAWADLDEARTLAAGLAGALEGIPLLGERHARPWRDAAVVLGGLASYRRASLVVVGRPASFRLELVARH